MEELERKIEEPGFWDCADVSQQIMKELKGLKDVIEKTEGLCTTFEDIGVLIEMAYEEEDASLIPEIAEDVLLICCPPAPLAR